MGCLFLTDKLRSLIKIEPVPAQVGDGFEQAWEQMKKIPLRCLVGVGVEPLGSDAQNFGDSALTSKYRLKG